MLLEGGLGGPAHDLLVVDHQDVAGRGCGAAEDQLARGGGFAGRPIRQGGEEDLEAAAFARPAVDFECALVGANDPEGGRKSETAACELGGEEGLENAGSG